MKYGIIHHFPGGTKDQYDRTLAAVHTGSGPLPEGQLFHAAGPSANGWTVIAVHDSKESWERFRDSILLPRLKQGINGGFTTPPEESAFEVANLLP
jgi:hypothetical protein